MTPLKTRIEDLEEKRDALDLTVKSRSEKMVNLKMYNWDCAEIYFAKHLLTDMQKKKEELLKAQGKNARLGLFSEVIDIEAQLKLLDEIMEGKKE